MNVIYSIGRIGFISLKYTAKEEIIDLIRFLKIEDLVYYSHFYLSV